MKRSCNENILLNEFYTIAKMVLKQFSESTFQQFFLEEPAHFHCILGGAPPPFPKSRLDLTVFDFKWQSYSLLIIETKM